MIKLPKIEWQEQNSSSENLQIKNSIITMLNYQVKSKFTCDKCFYFIAPEPARNISLFNEQLEALNLLNINETSAKVVRYGNKERGWGITFQDPTLLALLIPLFFNHGPEHLGIAAIKGSMEEEPPRLSIIFNEIMFGGSTVVKTEYTGLYFECGRLIELL